MSQEPSIVLTVAPEPSISTSNAPSILPLLAASSNTTVETKSPSVAPSSFPTTIPSIQPSQLPTVIPSVGPSRNPSSSPTFAPSQLPSESPFETPTFYPCSFPSAPPSLIPSFNFTNLTNTYQPISLNTDANSNLSPGAIAGIVIATIFVSILLISIRWHSDVYSYFFDDKTVVEYDSDLSLKYSKDEKLKYALINKDELE